MRPKPTPEIVHGEQTIITFYNCTQKVIADSPMEAKVTWAHIKTTMAPLLQKARLLLLLSCRRRPRLVLFTTPYQPSAMALVVGFVFAAERCPRLVLLNTPYRTPWLFFN